MKKYLSLLISLVLLLSLVSSCVQTSETVTITTTLEPKTEITTQINTLTETKVVEKNTTLTTTTTVTYNPYEKDYDVYDPAYLEKGSFKLGKNDLVDYYVIDECKYIKLYDSELLEKLELYENGNQLSDYNGNIFDLVNYVGVFDNIIRVKQKKETQSSSLPLVCLDDILNCFSHLTIEEDKIVVKNILSDYCEYGDHTFDNDGRYCDKCGWDRVYGKTMTNKEIKALKGQDPEIVAEKIKTAGDALTYFLEAEFDCPQYEERGYYDENDNHLGWSMARTGYEVIKNNYFCCCGGMANYTAYVLDGDYDEVGHIHQITINDQGHGYNYIKTGNEYYTIDITARDTSRMINFKDWSEYPDLVVNGYPELYKENIGYIISYIGCGYYNSLYPEQHDTTYKEINGYGSTVFPNEAKGAINIVYSTSNNVVTYKECNVSLTGYNEIVKYHDIQLEYTYDDGSTAKVGFYDTIIIGKKVTKLKVYADGELIKDYNCLIKRDQWVCEEKVLSDGTLQLTGKVSGCAQLAIYYDNWKYVCFLGVDDIDTVKTYENYYNDLGVTIHQNNIITRPGGDCNNGLFSKRYEVYVNGSKVTNYSVRADNNYFNVRKDGDDFYIEPTGKVGSAELYVTIDGFDSVYYIWCSN